MNLRLTGVNQQNPGETWDQTATIVFNIFKDKLQMSSIALERAHRTGRQDPQHPRPIVVRFEKYCDREAVLRNARKLKGTNIYVNEDLCPASQALRTSQLPQLKQARAQGKIAFFKYTRLIIKEKIPQQPFNQTSSSTDAPTHEPSTSRDGDLAYGSQQPALGRETDDTGSEAAVGAAPWREVIPALVVRLGMIWSSNKVDQPLLL